MIFDCHLHSNFSPDSKSTYQELFCQAEQKGLGLILTDHMDPIHYFSDPFCFEPDDFFEEYKPKRTENFLLGVELGLRESAKELVQKHLFTKPFDFILGSVHAPYQCIGPRGFDYDDTFAGMNSVEAQKYYFNDMLACIENYPKIDAIAHLDYIVRYSDIPGSYILLEECHLEIKRIMQALVELDIILEINTARFQKEQALGEWNHLLKIYSECGGEHITLGSDAHVPKRIGSSFKEALALAENHNLKPCYFKERKKCVSL